MDNQTSSPQLVFPSVPDDFCPAGNWTDVLQQFIDEVLSNGTINVPGLGDVTPTEIQTINAQLVSLQNQIDAMPDITIKSGQTAVTSTDAQYTVSFTTSMADTSYSVALTPVTASGTNPTARCYLVNGSKTTGGFSFMVESAEVHTTFVEWTAMHTA